MSAEACLNCGTAQLQLLKHITYKGHYYRVTRCLHCQTSRIEPLNPKRNPPTLHLCPKADLAMRTCRESGEMCTGIVADGNRVVGW